MRLALALSALAASCASAAGAGARPGLPPPTFLADVLPVLTKAGCNTGTCHGAATGQGGFKLSLLGYDPLSDYDHIVREFGGRRVNRRSPASSLILKKATARVPHGGGRRFAPGSPPSAVIASWLASGAAIGDPSVRVTGIRVTPANTLLDLPGSRTRLKVIASFSSGRAADVTRLALYSPLDDSIASVTELGHVTVKRRGATAIMIRFRGQVAAARVAVPVGLRPITKAGWKSRGTIDEAVFAELSRLRIPPSPAAGDAPFLRRAYLDLTGTLPPPERVRSFLAAPATRADRDALLERLLKGDEFTDYWTYKLADLLLVNRKRLGENGAAVYHGWLRRQVEQGIPLDAMARELLLATGDPTREGPPNFYRLTSDPRDMGEFVSRSLLGVRVQCARCHNHPFDRWTQDDYHAWAAAFARVNVEGGRVVSGARGEVPHPRTGKDSVPRALGIVAGPTGPDRRAAAVEMVTGKGKRLFAASMANRIWKHLMGRGVVEPVDDLRPTNPPSNPALLEALTDELIRLKFDLRGFVRSIVRSRTYQASSVSNDLNRSEERLFSRAYLKPMPAVVMADAIAQACGVPSEYAGRPLGTRAAELVDPQTPSYTLDVLGRCPRETGCEEPGQFGGGLSQALHLVVGGAVNEKLSGGTAAELSREGLPADKVVEELYIRALSRPPSGTERRHWEGVLAAARNRHEAVEDLLWALLNSREFAFIP